MSELLLIGSSLKAWITKAAILSVQAVSRFFVLNGLRACRYHPTCSRYSIEAFKTRSFFRACQLTVMRVLRCHPFSAGGYDPVDNK